VSNKVARQKNVLIQPPYILLCQERDAERFAVALGVPMVEKLEEAKRELEVPKFSYEGRLLCADADEIVGALEVAQRVGTLVWFDETAAQVAEGPPIDESGMVVYTHEAYGGTLRIYRLGAGESFMQTRSRYGGVIDRRLISPGETRILSVPRLRGASRRLLDYLGLERTGRLSHLHSPEQIARWLEQKNRPDWACLLAIEETLGGLVSAPDEYARRVPRMRFGPWLVLQLEEELREEGREPGDPGQPGWPFFYLADHLPETELCLVGTFWQEEHDLAVDKLGRVYFWDREADEVRLTGQTGLTTLEKYALNREFSTIMRYGWITIKADLGAAFAERAGLAQIPEASDAISEHYVGQNAWVHRRIAVPPNRPQMLIHARGDDETLRLALLAHAWDPAARMKIGGLHLTEPEQIRTLEQLKKATQEEVVPWTP
jgi:hypothetical protein